MGRIRQLARKWLGYSDQRDLVDRQSRALDMAERERTALLNAVHTLEEGNLRSRYHDALEMTEAASLSGSGLPMRRADEAGEVALGEAAVQLKERFWELELALEDRGWKRQLALSALEFSRYGIQQLILICRLYYIKNPLIRRGVKISSYYVFGRGFEISSEDPATNDLIEDFLEANQKELGHLGLVEKDQTLRTDGNLFFCFFTRALDGATMVRTIDAMEIVDIVCDPDDASVPRYYHRIWTGEMFNEQSGIVQMVPADCWYPALDYDPPDKPAMIGGKPCIWLSPILHVKAGGLPKWKFGCPEEYAAIDWARAYKKFLENWSTITEALARFAFTVETKGGQQAIANFSRALTTTLGDGGTAIETNPPPVVGSTFVSGPGNKVTPMRTTGATTEPEQGRRVLLMVAAAQGLPETFYGDASVGSVATAQSLDRPTELQFLERQEMWREVLTTICNYALERSAGAPRGALREAKNDTGEETGKEKDIRVHFPAVLEHDIKDMVAAVVEATTLNGFAPAGTVDQRTAARLLLRELGVEDIDTVVDAMYPEGSYDPDQTKNPPAQDQGPQMQGQQTAEAVRKLLDAAARLEERNKRHANA